MWFRLRRVGVWVVAATVLAPASTALGVPTAPTLTDVPDSFNIGYTRGGPYSARGLKWTPSRFSEPCRMYEIDVLESDTGTTQVYPWQSLAGSSWDLGRDFAPQTSFAALGYQPNFSPPFRDGYKYRFRVRGIEYGPAPSDPDRCTIPTSQAVITTGAWSNSSGPVVADFSRPEVTMRIISATPLARPAGLAPAFVVRSPTVTVEASATDPAPQGRAASGIAQVGVPGLAVASDQVTHSVSLVEGANDVTAYAWDRADNVGHVGSYEGVPDPTTVWRDTTAPVVFASHDGLWSTAPRVASAFEASGSDPGGPPDQGALTHFRWTFGDRSPPQSGERVTHAYARPGLYCGTLSAQDLAGNRGFTSFATRVGRRSVPRIGRTTISGPRRVGTTLTVRTCVAESGDLKIVLQGPNRRVISRSRQNVRPGYVTVQLRAKRRGPARITVTINGATKSIPITIR